MKLNKLYNWMEKTARRITALPSGGSALRRAGGRAEGEEQLPPLQIPHREGPMEEAMELWSAMYAGDPPWLGGASGVQSLQIPAALASEVARLVTLEAEGWVEPVPDQAQVRPRAGLSEDGQSLEKTEAGFREQEPADSGQGLGREEEADPFQGQTERAQTASSQEEGGQGLTRGAFLQRQLAPVMERLRQWTEYACALGGVVFKPYFSGGPGQGELYVECIRGDGFYPLAWDSRGRITRAVFSERFYRDRRWYTRLELHDLRGDRYRIENRAYTSPVPLRPWELAAQGQELGLEQVERWRGLAPVVELVGVKQPLFSYFRIPQANQIDPDSPLGVSIYSRAVGLIREADRQYSRILWEYEGSELAVDASSDLFRLDGWGRPILPKGRERLFRALDMDSGDGKGLQVFSPAIRDASLFHGLDRLLKRIEYNCGLSYGTLSDLTETQKTATEILASRQRLYATVSDIQKALEASLRELVGAMDCLAQLYRLTPPGDYRLQFCWDDSVLVDADTERQRDREEVREGLMSPWEFRRRWYGEEESAARRMAEEAQTGTAVGPERPFGAEGFIAAAEEGPER